MAPDGDAMGSALALYHWLKNQPTTDNSQSVQVVVPNAFPAFFNWMPDAEKIHIYEKDAKTCETLINQADLFLCSDYNDPKRIGPIGERLMANNAPKILIDHHLHPTDFANIVFSFPEATSSCEIVYRFITQILENQSPISKEIATAIYTGLMTDTGNFAFNSNNPVLYEMIAELLRAGINKDRIFDNVFNQYTSNRMELMGYCLFRKMKIYKKYHTALITLSSSELRRFGYQKGDTEGFVNLPLQISDVYYSVFMREDSDRIKLSFRSQGDRPVNILAHDFFNGGGHMNAAGGESFGTLDNTVKTFEDHFRDYFNK